MIIWDSEVQSPEEKSPPFTPSCVAWYNTVTMTSSSEIKINFYPDFSEFTSEAANDNVLVGYNVLSFDLPNFEKTDYPPSFAKEKTFDLLWFLSFQVTGTYYKRPKGLKLHEIGLANLSRGKIELKATPAKLYEAKEYEMLEIYVKNDVALTKDLFFMMLSYNFLRFLTEQKYYEDIDCSPARDWIDNIDAKAIWGW